MIETALYVPRPASDISRAIAGVLGRNWLDYLAMPELCRFLGMIITMYYDDHAPPHFHIRYGDTRQSWASILSCSWMDTCLHGHWDWLRSGAPYTGMNCGKTGHWPNSERR